METEQRHSCKTAATNKTERLRESNAKSLPQWFHLTPKSGLEGSRRQTLVFKSQGCLQKIVLGNGNYLGTNLAKCCRNLVYKVSKFILWYFPHITSLVSSRLVFIHSQKCNSQPTSSPPLPSTSHSHPPLMERCSSSTTKASVCVIKICLLM